MANNSAKHTALKILIKHKRYSLNNYIDLQNIIESNKFTIIEYKKHANSEYVSELIKRLGVEKEIEQHDSFLYIKKSLKFVFINRDISDEDKCSLLRHELGHICDPDLENSDLQNSRIKKEEFANEFSCHTKNPGICFKVYVFLIKHWKLSVTLMALIVCALGFLLMHNTPNLPTEPVISNTPTTVISDSEYYVTSAGKKYHKKHCMIIKYKNNLTKMTLTEAISKGYKPCQICNPEE